MVPKVRAPTTPLDVKRDEYRAGQGERLILLRSSKHLSVRRVASMNDHVVLPAPFVFGRSVPVSLCGANSLSNTPPSFLVHSFT